MTQFYEVWDDTTANRLGEYETLAEARALLDAVLRESGPDAVRSLAVLTYAGSEETAGEYQVTTVLEGADFVSDIAKQAR